MKRILTVIILAVPVLVVGCLPTTPAEAGVGVVLLGLGPVLTGLLCSYHLFKVEGERKTAARFFLGGLFLIGGGLMALGARWAGWWGQ
jgi:hypothetical protein